MRIFAHLLTISAGLFIFLGIPLLRYVDLAALSSGRMDAVSSATAVPDDAPSGEFLILLNRDRHPDSIDEWTDFFEERPVGVIMEDLSCFTPAEDRTGQELAKRYRQRLAENQMKTAEEEGLLLVSKAEQGLFDVIILSKEMADHYDYSRAAASARTEVIRVRGDDFERNGEPESDGTRGQ